MSLTRRLVDTLLTLERAPHTGCGYTPTVMKKQKPLTQFVGALAPQQVADGMNAAGRNAKRLYEDAELLFNASRFASACALAVLSIEEAGKVSVLRGISTASGEKELKA